MFKSTLIAAILVAGTAQANCSLLGDLAENVMKSRQANVPISKLMGATDELGVSNDKALELYKSLVLMAYGRPRYNTPEFRNQSVADFRNQFETACYSSKN